MSITRFTSTRFFSVGERTLSGKTGMKTLDGKKPHFDGELALFVSWIDRIPFRSCSLP